MIATKTARDFMPERMMSVAPDLDVREAIRLLVREKISGVPVVDETGALVGYLSEKDCFRVCFCCSYHQDLAGPVSDYMTLTVTTVDADADIVSIAGMFMKGPFRRFPVVQGDQVVGVINRHDALRALLDIS